MFVPFGVFKIGQSLRIVKREGEKMTESQMIEIMDEIKKSFGAEVNSGIPSPEIIDRLITEMTHEIALLMSSS